MAGLIINTSKFTVHELREFVGERFRATAGPRSEAQLSPEKRHSESRTLTP
jgi:hypothetical protein